MPERLTVFNGRRSMLCAAVVLLAAWLGGCGRTDPGSPGDGPAAACDTAPYALLDPQVVDLGPGYPWNAFDGAGGRLLVGEGWAPPETDDRGAFAWIVGTEASLHFGDHGGLEDRELRALCRSLRVDGSGGQRVTVAIGGRVAGQAAITDQWSEIVVPVPGALIAAGVNRIDLQFAWAKKPAELGLNQDQRALAAACRWVALAPGAQAGRTGEPVDPLPLRRATNQLELRRGVPASVPIPPRTRLTARFEALSAPEPAAEVAVDVIDGSGSARSIWRGRVGTGWRRSLEVVNNGAAVETLRIGVRGAGTGAALSDGLVTLDWRPEAFSVARLARLSSGNRPPHVFIYAVDTLRADALALLGGDRPTSPELEAFAQDSVTFRNAVAASTWTLPSVASILTGVYPFRHGVVKGDAMLAADGSHPTLASVLSGVGYETVGISQSYIVGPQFGLDAGFSRFFVENHLNGWGLRTESVRRVLTEWLMYEHDWERPIFAYIHTVGPHAPYRPVDPFRTFAHSTPGALAERSYLPSLFITEGYGRLPPEVDHLRALYDGEVAYEDREFGHFVDQLKYLGLYDDSLIVFVSDHGEEFAEHGGFDHGRTVYEEVARVPLVVKFPGPAEERGTSVNERVSTVDIFATVLAAIGVLRPDLELDGQDLPASSAELPPGEASHRTILSELDVAPNPSYRAVAYRVIWGEALKCVESLSGRDRFGAVEPRVRAFDLAADPGEQAPLPESDLRFERCLALAGLWSRAIDGQDTPARDGALVSDEAAEMLRALGYVQ